jgi:hypothetical protein
VFPGLIELLLQCFCSEHCVAVSLEHVRFLSGPLHDILHKATIIIEYSILAEFDYSRVLPRTFIHCLARHIDSKLRATITGSIRSSARSSNPPRLVVAVSDIGAGRIGSASWISGDRTTMLDSGSTLSCTSSVISRAIGTSGPEVAPPSTSA